MTHLQDVKGILIDLDGTLFRGATAIPEAVVFVEHVRQRGIPLLFWTNNSMRTPEVVAVNLSQLGFPAQATDVYTSSMAMADTVVARFGRSASVFLIGEEGLRSAVSAILDSPLLQEAAMGDGQLPQADAVVVGLDRQVTYQQLRIATKLIAAGAPLLATNADRMLPEDVGFAPGAGALLAVLETATGKKAEVVGKPSAEFVRAACRRLHVAVTAVVIIGDNLETDIRSGRAAGAKTVWVTTGVPGTPSEETKPLYQVAHLEMLLPLFDS